MVVANKSSKYVWAYQAAHGTASITAVNSTTYEFGEYNDACGKWNTPFVENKTLPSWVYSSRTPTLTDLESEFPTFSHAFLPVSAQPFAWMLGNPSNTTPTVTIGALHTGRKTPLTIRNEELEGTRPNNAQAVDCHCVGLTAVAERSKEFIVECEFAWGKLQDIKINPNLTTAPTACGECTNSYDGNPIITWDIGDDNVAIPEVERAMFKCAQEWEKVSSGAGATQIVYTYKQQPVQIMLTAVLQTLNPTVEGMWRDYMDRKAATNMTLQVKKHNATNYITFTFTNCRVQSVKKTGDRNEGHYTCTANIIAEKVECVSDWFTDHGEGPTFATHWKVALA